MNYYKIALLLTTLLSVQSCTVNGPVHAYPGQTLPSSETARIRVPGPITVQKIDWKEIDVPSEADGFYEIYVLPGEHRIDFKYELYWGDNTSGLMIKSDSVAVEAQFNAGMTYNLTYDVPKNEDEAFEYTKKFQATLVEVQTGRQIVSATEDELNASRMKNSQANSSVAGKNNSKLPASDAERAISPNPVDAKTAANENAVKRLKFWWLIADKEERQQFKAWLKTVEKLEETNK